MRPDVLLSCSVRRTRRRCSTFIYLFLQEEADGCEEQFSVVSCFLWTPNLDVKVEA